MSKVKVFIINGLPESGIATFVHNVASYKQNVTLIESLFPVIHVHDSMKDSPGCNTKLLLELKELWSRHNDLWYTRFIDYLLEEIEERLNYTANSVLFIKIADRKTMDRTIIKLKGHDVYVRTILIRRDGVKYPDILAHYDLSDNYNVIVYNNKSIKDLKRKSIEFRRKFINRTRKANDTIIF